MPSQMKPRSPGGGLAFGSIGTNSHHDFLIVLGDTSESAAKFHDGVTAASAARQAHARALASSPTLRPA